MSCTNLQIESVKVIDYQYTTNNCLVSALQRLQKVYTVSSL
jgi:hypothetical protein